MTDELPPYGDALTAPFWAAARRNQLLVQRCADCEHCQLYPRRYCLNCGSGSLDWKVAAGTGTVYSSTTVWLETSPEFEPPYVVALVELDEGPRLLTNIVGETCAVGDRVEVGWRDRPDLPPVPIFTAATERRP